jgi:hypothetical protein
MKDPKVLPFLPDKIQYLLEDVELKAPQFSSSWVCKTPRLSYFTRCNIWYGDVDGFIPPAMLGYWVSAKNRECLSEKWQ